MGGEGSILSMITSLRSNKNLLRRKSIFEKENLHPCSELNSDKIVVKPLSQEDREKIRKKVRQESRKLIIHRLLYSLIMLSVISLGIYLGLRRFSNNYVEGIKQKEIRINEAKASNYESLITNANFFISNEQWGEAIFQLKKAINIFPERLEAKTVLADTYVNSCLNQSTYCSEGIVLLGDLIRQLPENTKFLELRALIFESMGEFEKAEADYKSITKIIKTNVP